MNDYTLPLSAQNDCWNRIGVRGDGSCERLQEHLHCRNCGVYADAAQRVMRRSVPADYRRAWADLFAQEEPAARAADRSTLVFRIGREWLGLPATCAVTIAEIVAPHRIPHRRGPLLRGIVNIRGRLYPCMSLEGLLEVTASDVPPRPGRRVYPRMLVARLESHAFAIEVQDLYGIHRHGGADVQQLPATAQHALHRFVSGILEVEDMRVGCLDAELVGYRFSGALK